MILKCNMERTNQQTGEVITQEASFYSMIKVNEQRFPTFLVKLSISTPTGFMLYSTTPVFSIKVTSPK